MSYFYNIVKGQTLVLKWSVDSSSCSGTSVSWSMSDIVESPPTAQGEEFFAVSINTTTSTITISSDSEDTVAHEVYLSPSINSNKCESLITVRQEGTTPTPGCECISTIQIPTINASGASANSVIGTMTLAEGCSFSNVSFTSSTLSLSVDGNGNVKTLNVIPETNTGASFNVEVYYNGTKCRDITITQTAAECGCSMAAYYIDMFQSSWGVSGSCESSGCNNVLIGSGHTECGYLVPTCNSDMLDGGEMTYSHDSNGFYFYGTILKNNTGLVRAAGVTFTLVGNDGQIIESGCNINAQLIQARGTNSSCNCKNFEHKKYPYDADTADFSSEYRYYFCFYKSQTYNPTYYFRALRFSKNNWNNFVNKFGHGGEYEGKLFIGTTPYSEYTICDGRAIGTEIAYIDPYIENLFDHVESASGITLYPKHLESEELNEYFDQSNCNPDYSDYSSGHKITLKHRVDAQINGDEIVLGTLCDKEYDYYLYFDVCAVCYCVFEKQNDMISQYPIDPVVIGPDYNFLYYYGDENWLTDNNLWDNDSWDSSEHAYTEHPSWLHVEKLTNPDYPDEPYYMISAQTNDTGEERIALVLLPDKCDDDYFFRFTQEPCDCGEFYQYTDGKHDEGSRTWYCDDVSESLVWQREYCVKKQVFLVPVSGDTTHWNFNITTNDVGKSKILAKPVSKATTDDGSTYYRGHWKVKMDTAPIYAAPNHEEYVCPDGTHYEEDLILEHYDCYIPPTPTAVCSCNDFRITGNVSGGGSYSNTPQTINLGNLSISCINDRCDGSDVYLFATTTQSEYIYPDIDSSGNVTVNIYGTTLPIPSQNVAFDIHYAYDGGSKTCYYRSVFFTLNQ